MIRTTYSDRSFFTVLVAPAVVVTAVLTLYPVLSVWNNSLFNFDYIAGTREFVGLRNYRSILTDGQFLQSVSNTVVFVILAVVFETGLGFALALLYFRPFRGSKTVAMMTMAPMMLSTMVVSAIWRTMFHFDIGLLNYLIENLGLQPVRWLIDPDIALFSVVLVDVWQWTPFAFIILSAALRTVPPEYLEAARIDGSGNMGLLRHIIVPLMATHLLTVAMLRTIDTFRLFSKVYALTGGGPGNATETISYFIYREAFSFFNLGRAGAASVVAFVLIAGVAAVYIPRLLKGDA
ncbi:MAG: sugar ABC transporter permease [Spirochaeta sp.]|jgi:multiple sugar transport system permease protein|nr:sugar ABC transporter permease [Spirochaeta sp.]